MNSFIVEMAASVDVREEMEPHPCFDFLVWFDPERLTRRSVFLNVLRHADKLVCSPAGVAFVSEVDQEQILNYYFGILSKQTSFF